MTVRTLVGDIFESSAQTLINTVNTVGVMGKGIALEFKRRFPEMHRDYLLRSATGQIRLGEPYLFKSLIPPWILNFPTKEHWRSVSRVSDIVRGLEYLEKHYRGWGITSLAVPPLGCGLGQLEWKVVGPTLYRHLSRLDISVELFAPHGTPADQLDPQFLRTVPASSQSTDTKRIEAGWVALAEILARIEREPYHWPVGRTIFQKIAFFATEEGIPTGLRFTAESYGPFSSQVKSMLTKLVNNGLLVEGKLGRMFQLKPGPTLEDAAEAFRSEISSWEPLIERIADLFLRMTTEQAEIAATVLYAARHLAPRALPEVTEKDILESVKQWKRRRRPNLSDEDVAGAIRTLNFLGWLHAKPSRDLPVFETSAADA
jgi:uncharacterized protein YwgA/O-acetyl-ADP-ribose deacetylase (regulator of RNase III)